MRQKRRLYTPHLDDENGRRLYRLAQERRMPMTRLLNLIVQVAVQTREGQDTVSLFQNLISRQEEGNGRKKPHQA